MNYENLAKEILVKIGGKENVGNVTHCVTRLRFELKDSSIPNQNEIEKIDGVMKVIHSGGQYQIVIGNKVADVFKEVSVVLGDTFSTSTSQATEEKLSFKDKFTKMIVGIFTPALGVMAGTGMLKGILSILLITKVLSDSSGTYKVLYAISDTLFYFFPVFLGAASAKYFKMNQYFGMAIGACMLYPSLIESASKNEVITFLKIPMHILNYSSTVFPVIVATWFASKVEKIAEKYSHSSVKLFLVPMLVLVVTMPLTFFIIGPVMTSLSNLLSKVIMTAYNFSPILGGLVLGGPWILIVLFGLHWAFIPIFITDIVTNGSSLILGLLTANMFAMAGAAFGIAIGSKNKKERELALSTGSTCLFGVSEPLIYGLLLPLKKPLIMSVIGGSIGGAISGIFQNKLYGFGGSGILQIPMLINPSGLDKGFYGGVISCVVAFITSCILTVIFKNKDKVYGN